jgi:hypothetical protein
MSSLTDRLTVLATVAQKPRRDFSIQWAGIATVSALAAAAPAYVRRLASRRN